MDVLRAAFDALHQHFSGKYGTSRDPKDFEEAVRILEGGFLTIKDASVSYVNPSFRDYMAEYVKDIVLLRDCAITAQRASWAKAVWETGQKLPLTQDEKATFAQSFAGIAERFETLPTWRATSGQPRGSWSPSDLSNSARLRLLLEWWSATRDSRFASLSVSLAKNPPGFSNSRSFNSWRDGTELVELVRELRDGDYFVDFPAANELVDELEDGLVKMLSYGVAMDDLDNISDAVANAGSLIGDDVREATEEAIRVEFTNVESNVADVDSESTLEDHIKLLEKLGPRAGVKSEDVVAAVKEVRGRIEELAEEASTAESPSVPRPKAEDDVFDDAALRNLVLPLLRKE